MRSLQQILMLSNNVSVFTLSNNEKSIKKANKSIK